MKTLPSDMFLGADYLISIEIPDEIDFIGRRCFRGCSNLEYIKLPKKLRNFGDYCFSNCYQLKKIEYPDKSKYFTSLVNFNNNILWSSYTHYITCIDEEVRI